MDTSFSSYSRSFFKSITSESVGCGHPDKVADAISDAILDACLAQDPESRVGCETLVKGNQVILAGEITTKAKLDYEQIVRDTVRSIGYRTAQDDPVFNSESLNVTNLICEQSPDIALGVDENKGEGKEQGAGDQGMMFGYACNETPELMPAPIMFAHRIMRKLEEVRKSRAVAWLRPDAKCQVTVEYSYENGYAGKPCHISAVVLSTQHSPDVTREEIENICLEVIKSSLPASLVSPATQFHINPTGRFVTGGPQADCGLTGRKIIADTYGGVGRHGGGAFSGKDASKVDRSAAYMCRWVAKHIVASGLAKHCEVQVSYAIGKSEPVSVEVMSDCSFLTSDELARRVKETFSFKPADIIEALGLKNPIFSATTNYGHFGKADLPWEQINSERIIMLQKG